MSGVDSPRGGNGGGGIDIDISCDRLHFETDVRSPNPGVVGQIQVGNVLEVQLRQGPPSTIVLVFRGQDVGGLVSPKSSRLRECLAGGTRYTATVISIRGASIIKTRIAPVL